MASSLRMLLNRIQSYMDNGSLVWPVQLHFYTCYTFTQFLHVALERLRQLNHLCLREGKDLKDYY